MVCVSVAAVFASNEMRKTSFSLDLARQDVSSLCGHEGMDDISEQ